MSLYLDTGLWGVYAGVSKKRIKEVAELIISEMLMLRDTINNDELERAKKQLKGNLILSLESTSSRMNNIARQEIYFGKYISPNEIMKSVDMVSLEQIKELSGRLIKKDLFSIAAYGNLQKDILDDVI
jgi:predicted Zn-dependent peptidase